jgi:hypothetical protein
LDAIRAGAQTPWAAVRDFASEKAIYWLRVFLFRQLARLSQNR